MDSQSGKSPNPKNRAITAQHDAPRWLIWVFVLWWVVPFLSLSHWYPAYRYGMFARPHGSALHSRMEVQYYEQGEWKKALPGAAGLGEGAWEQMLGRGLAKGNLPDLLAIYAQQLASPTAQVSQWRVLVAASDSGLTWQDTLTIQLSSQPKAW